MFPLIRWLFTHTVGLAIWAGLGFLFVCCGGLGFFLNPEEHPTVLKAAELESRNEPPAQQWLEVTEVYLAWPAAKELVTFRKKRGSDEVTNETAKTIYVPLVSKDTLEIWAKLGPNKAFPTTKIRVYLKVDASAAEKEFAEDKAAWKNGSLEHLKPQKMSGLAGKLSGEDKVVVEGLAVPGVDASKIVVLRNQERPPTKEASIITAILLVLIGLALPVPLVLRLVLGKKPERKSGLQGAVAAGVRAGVEAAVRKQVQEAIADTTQWYYLQEGKSQGPVSLGQLRDLWKGGRLGAQTLVCQVGATEWLPVERLRGRLERG